MLNIKHVTAVTDRLSDETENMSKMIKYIEELRFFEKFRFVPIFMIIDWFIRLSGHFGFCGATIFPIINQKKIL